MGRSYGAQVPTSGMAFWLDATKVAGADGDPQSSWTDQSGNGNNVTNAGGAARPVLKTAIINGNNVIRFNSGVASQFFDVPSVFGSATAGEIIVVAQAAADPAASSAHVGAWTICGTGGSVGDNAWPFTDGKIYENFALTTSNARHTAIDAPGSLASPRIYNVRAQAGQYMMRLDGDIIHCDDDATIGFGGGTRSIGRGIAAGSTFWKGDIGEILCWTRVLTAVERKVVHDYLAAKWLISVSNVNAIVLPSDFSGLDAWFKIDTLSGLSNGNAVTSWTDQSGNGRDITQGTGAAQPVYNTGIFNGGPAVRYTTAKSLAFASDLTIAASTPCTLIVLGQYNADCSAVGHTTDNVQLRCRRGGVNQMGMFFNGGAEAVSSTFPRAVGNAHMGVWRRTATPFNAMRFLQNGDQPTGGGVNTTGQMRIKSIGGGSVGINLNGDLTEVCIWTGTELTDLQCWNLYEQYFRGKYALP